MKIHNIKTCKICKSNYSDVLKETKKIKDKKLRDNLHQLWDTLWLNNCQDFDIIADLFDVN